MEGLEIKKPIIGKAEIIDYSSNKIVINTENSDQGFLVLTDSFYPSWHVKINGIENNIYKTDFNFRGVIVPSGKNEIIFENKRLICVETLRFNSRRDCYY